MAVIQNPIVGRAKNQAGGMIFQTQRGQNTMRARPLTVANPRSEKQRVQRNRLATLSFLGRVMRSLYLLGFREVQGVASQWNKFVQANILTATFPDPVAPNYVNSEELRIADGSLSPVLPETATVSTTEALITYNPNKVTTDDQDTDLVSILVIKRESSGVYVESFQDYFPNVQGAIGGTSGATDRTGGAIVMDFTNLNVAVGDTVDIYLFASSQDTDKVSVSTHISAVVA